MRIWLIKYEFNGHIVHTFISGSTREAAIRKIETEKRAVIRVISCSLA